MAKSVPEPQPEETDESTALLEQAAQLLGKAASDRKNRDQALKEVEGVLSKLKMVDFPELAESPIVAAFVKAMGMGDLKPGEVKNKGTLAEREREWNYKDLQDPGQFKQVTFTPAETVPITWNGLSFQLVADEEITVPEPIWNVYREHREALKQAGINERYLMGQSDIAPHPNWQTAEAALVRAWSTRQGPNGQKSGRLGVGAIYGSGTEGEKSE